MRRSVVLAMRSFAALSLAAILILPNVRADSPRHALWQIKGATSSVYLMGSVHFLRQSDYPLPEAFINAYQESDELVMELDMDDLDPLLAAQLMMVTGQLSDGKTLRDVMGPTAYAEAARKANNLQINLDMLSSIKPWFVALTVLQLELAKHGFDPSSGIDFYFTERARSDNKPIRGLESLEEQLQIFDDMPMDKQSDFLLMSLEDAQTMDQELGKLLKAWRAGDAATLAHELHRGFEDFPRLYDRLIVQRNRDWAQQINGLLRERGTYLVVVGALHLVGKHSVIEMLEKYGFEARQL